MVKKLRITFRWALPFSAGVFTLDFGRSGDASSLLWAIIITLLYAVIEASQDEPK